MIAQRDIPKIIWIHVMFIMAIGLVALYSASFNNTRVVQDVFFDQLYCVAFGLGVMLFLSHLNYRKYFDFESITRSRTLRREPTGWEEIHRIACELLEQKTEAGTKPVRLLGLGISGLEHAEEQIQPGQKELFPL